MDDGGHVGAFLAADPLPAFDGQVAGEGEPPRPEDDQEAQDDDGGPDDDLEAGGGGVAGGHEATEAHHDHDGTDQHPCHEERPAPAFGRTGEGRLFEGFAEEAPLLVRCVAPDDHQAGGAEREGPDETGGETEAEGGECDQRAAEDGGQGDAQSQGATVRESPPGDRAVLALPGDEEPGEDVEDEPGGPAQGEDGEDQPDGVGVDPEAGREPPRHPAGHPLGGAAAQGSVLSGDPPAGPSAVARSCPVGEGGIVGDESMIAWGHPRDHRVGPRDGGLVLGVRSG